MKKINFKNLSNDEILTRSQLKAITGGLQEGSGGVGVVECSCPDGTGTTLACDEMSYSECEALCRSILTC